MIPPCSADPELWFNPDLTSDAKDICDTCPAKARCLEIALAREGNLVGSSRWGVWGGLTPDERAALDENAAEKLCEHCGKGIVVILNVKPRRYCSAHCQKTAWYLRNGNTRRDRERRANAAPKVCTSCGEPIAEPRSTKKFCSEKCRHKHHAKRRDARAREVRNSRGAA